LRERFDARHSGDCARTEGVRVKELLRIVLGANGASVWHLLHGDLDQFVAASRRAFRAARDMPLPPSYPIPTLSLSTILGDRRPRVSVRPTDYEHGILPMHELVVLLGILIAEQPAEVLEIGTYMGYTTREMAEALDTAVIHTVDLPGDFVAKPGDSGPLPKDDWDIIARRVVGREFRGTPAEKRIRQHYADTATWDFREAGHPTFFFIDGSHTYEHARHDSEQCYSLTGGRGVFLWHDCNFRHPGVERTLFEWRQAGRDVRRIAGTTLAYWKGDASEPVGAAS
jgi:hypothetical protein